MVTLEQGCQACGPQAESVEPFHPDHRTFVWSGNFCKGALEVCRVTNIGVWGAGGGYLKCQEYGAIQGN